MEIDLRPLTHADAAAHCAGEDAETVRWLTGSRGTVEQACAAFDELAANARAGRGKRGFGVWWQERLAGYVDFDPDLADGLEDDDVNLTYAVHPWARGHDVAPRAVEQVCASLTEQGIGSRAAIRLEPSNARSVRVAQKCGFTYVRDFVSELDVDPFGRPHTLSLYVRAL